MHKILLVLALCVLAVGMAGAQEPQQQPEQQQQEQPQQQPPQQQPPPDQQQQQQQPREGDTEVTGEARVEADQDQDAGQAGAQDQGAGGIPTTWLVIGGIVVLVLLIAALAGRGSTVDRVDRTDRVERIERRDDDIRRAG